MRTDDQWFQPGDKVVRVGDGGAGPSWNRLHPEARITGAPQYGRVYCVEDFWEGPMFNVVMLVGFGGWRYHGKMKVGWSAKSFRKVEEIKLCVRAAEKMKQPHEEQPA